MNNKSYVWPIEIGGIYIEYKLENETQKIDYNDILNTTFKKLCKYDTYNDHSNEFTSKDNINKIITNKLGKDWELKKPLIDLFPINKRICKYELLKIIDELKKKYSNVLDELNKEDPSDAKIRFFYFNSFYCDTLIYLLNKKTNFKKSVPAHELLINFKTNTIENKNKSISLYQVDPCFSEEDKKLIEDVIKVLEYDDNILEDNKIKNIHCKNDGDIESIELHWIF